MEQSPLTHQPRPEVFTPKVVRLYEELFKVRFLSQVARSFRKVWVERGCSRTRDFFYLGSVHRTYDGESCC